MAAKIINEHHACNRPSREESIWELAEMASRTSWNLRRDWSEPMKRCGHSKH